jgi:hypothetical protein
MTKNFKLAPSSEILSRASLREDNSINDDFQLILFQKMHGKNIKKVGFDGDCFFTLEPQIQTTFRKCFVEVSHWLPHQSNP